MAVHAHINHESRKRSEDVPTDESLKGNASIEVPWAQVILFCVTLTNKQTKRNSTSACHKGMRTYVLIPQAHVKAGGESTCNPSLRG